MPLPQNRRLLPTVLLISFLSLTLAAAEISARHHPESLTQSLNTIPRSVEGWTLNQQTPLPRRILERLVLTDYVSRVYSKKAKQLGLFVAYYAEQRSGESMHSPKQCLPGSGWEIWRYGSVTVPLKDRQVVVNNYSIQKGGERNVVLYWYQSGPRIIASEYLGKMLLMRDALWNGRTDGALVRIVLPDQPGAVEEGVRFASALVPEIERCFGRPSLTGSAMTSFAGNGSE
jgi:EpsI family protein